MHEDIAHFEDRAIHILTRLHSMAGADVDPFAPTCPVLKCVLLYAHSKGDQDDLDGKQRNAMRVVTRKIVDAYGRRKSVRRVK